MVIFLIIISILLLNNQKKENDYVFSLKNGTQLMAPLNNDGYNYIKIENGNSKDVVVKLAEKETNEMKRFVYIKKKSNYTIKNITPGIYQIYCSLGQNCCNDNMEFKENLSYFTFMKDILLTETNENYTYYVVSL